MPDLAGLAAVLYFPFNPRGGEWLLGLEVCREWGAGCLLVCHAMARNLMGLPMGIYTRRRLRRGVDADLSLPRPMGTIANLGTGGDVPVQENWAHPCPVGEGNSFDTHGTDFTDTVSRARIGN